MALATLSIDTMLPALLDIVANFNLTDPNRRQLVVILYFVGFGIQHLF